MNQDSLSVCRQALREAIPSLAEASPITASVQHLRAWLVLYQITEKHHWLDLLRSGCSATRLRALTPAERGDWLRLCCDGWVIDAAGPFRDAANRLSAQALEGDGAVEGLLRNWRITGDGSFRDRALAQLPPAAEIGTIAAVDTFAAAAALYAAYQASGDQSQFDAALRPFAECSPADLPLRWWPLAWDVLDWDHELVAPTVQSWQQAPPPPEDIVPALAPLCLPRLDLEVRWWDAHELNEGYVAEAVTFPYPALSLRFLPREGPGQVLFAPRLGGEAREALEDAGVVASLLHMLVDEVDRQAAVNPPRSRRSKGTIRR